MNNMEILSSQITNKVRYNGQAYLRMFNIEESGAERGDFINLQIFQEVKPDTYLPFYRDGNTDAGLLDRLTTTDETLDENMSDDEIRKFLLSLNLYVDNTYVLVRDSVSKLLPAHSMFMYKEYLGVFYAVVHKNEDAVLYEVKITADGKVRFSYVNPNVAERIIMRDFCQYVSDEKEFYIKMSEDKYLIFTNILGKRCYMHVEVLANKKYNLKSVRFTEAVSPDTANEVPDLILEKLKHMDQLL